MITATCNKWGCSFGIRIPIKTAAELGITEKEKFKIELKSGNRILLTPLDKKQNRLDMLLAKIDKTPEHEAFCETPRGLEDVD